MLFLKYCVSLLLSSETRESGIIRGSSAFISPPHSCLNLFVYLINNSPSPQGVTIPKIELL